MDPMVGPNEMFAGYQPGGETHLGSSLDGELTSAFLMATSTGAQATGSKDLNLHLLLMTGVCGQAYSQEPRACQYDLGG